MSELILAGCPVCRARYRLDGKRIGGEGIKLRCSGCRTVFRVRGKVPAISAAPAVSGAMALVLVAHDSEAFRTAVRHALAGEPFEVLEAVDGTAAYATILEHRPQVAVLDVALSGMFAFEICEAVKENPATSGIKIILIASIYDKAKYKRSPESLYGADDYLEKHHIPDELPARIYRLLTGAAPAVQRLGGDDSACGDGQAVAVGEKVPGDGASEERTRTEIRDDEVQKGQVPSGEEDALPEAHLKARRLARLIVSDIALYNHELVREGVRNGTFFELLADDVAEGRTLYENRVAGDVRAGTAYLDEAFAEFIDKMKREFDS